MYCRRVKEFKSVVNVNFQAVPRIQMQSGSFALTFVWTKVCCCGSTRQLRWLRFIMAEMPNVAFDTPLARSSYLTANTKKIKNMEISYCR